MKVDVRVGQCMTVGVFTLPADKMVIDAARLLRKTSIGSIIVMRKGKACGIITERDIVYKVVAEGKDPRKTKLSSIMSRPLKVIKASDKIEAAISALRANKIKRLPVIDKNNKLVGIITEGDLLRAYPGMVDVISELQEIRKSKPNEIYTGVCEICGCFAEDLRREEGKLKCQECIEEGEI